jgi:cyclopropane-fatty-acyl-phospholipid synthase
VTFHYNVSNDFYALWLDQRMVYSCAYFETADEDLDTSQERKLDYLCRKLRLVPGERLLDIGCGWGGLVIHAAQRYGVQALALHSAKTRRCWRTNESHGAVYKIDAAWKYATTAI